MDIAKVGIISSVFNKGPWLERFLDSLINQTFPDIEIVLVNNGSTDDSAEVIKRYSSEDSRIKTIMIAENIGPANGIAIGINNVTADYFTICDADDYVEPDYVEVLYHEMITENADVVMCTNDYIYNDGTRRVNNCPDEEKIVFSGKDVEKLLPQLLDHLSNEYLGYYLAEIGATWPKLYRTSLIIRENINYEKEAWVWSDWLFNFRVLKKISKFVYTQRTVYHNYISENSATRPAKFIRKRFDEMEYVLKRIAQECADVNDDEHKLYKARGRFTARVIFGQVGYYRKFYKTDLGLKEEIDYLDKIRASTVTQNMDITLNRTGVSLYKLRLFLLRHRIYLIEIAYMFFESWKGKKKK